VLFVTSVTLIGPACLLWMSASHALRALSWSTCAGALNQTSPLSGSPVNSHECLRLEDAREDLLEVVLEAHDQRRHLQCADDVIEARIDLFLRLERVAVDGGERSGLTIELETSAETDVPLVGCEADGVHEVMIESGLHDPFGRLNMLGGEDPDENWIGGMARRLAVGVVVRHLGDDVVHERQAGFASRLAATERGFSAVRVDALLRCLARHRRDRIGRP